MLFNSYIFILFFLPVTVSVYFLINKIQRFENTRVNLWWLFFMSLWFYGYSNPVYLILILSSICVNFFVGKQIASDRKKDNRKMEKIKFGILGCGMIANFHADAIKNIGEAELVCAADNNITFAEKFAENHGISACGSYDELLENVDAVCICTPSGFHGENAIKALEKGKVELNSTLDLERIVKLTLLVSGEADSIQGSSKTTETETSVESAKIAMSKVEEILDSDDPTVNEIFNKLYEGYNKMNDESSGN